MCRLQTVQAKPANIISLEKFQKSFKICPKKVQKSSNKHPKSSKNGQKNGHNQYISQEKPKTNPCLISDRVPAIRH